ncbi:SDR family oxidoreductase [Inhella gelatinilytica]|uniref:SDR family oxidoreductase n=1 Tax=Inhella gelatinilytica TaxID=2795030 RepID=A0A931IVK6_9BURK|nr:SDR family oxidoreductase [Inhella gelatinilytica]MBH9553615.1 SDR family oxidoreductase [Inhella gelatinilytica]
MSTLAANPSAPLVFITGASSGIGQALALRYYQAGWRLALLARRTEVVTTWAQAEGLDAARWAVYEADVVDAQALQTAAAHCVTTQGLPDTVIASAGVSIGVDTALAEDLPVFKQVLDTNLYGTAVSFQPFIEPMRRRGSGRLVGVASVAAIRGLAGHGAYCASKAGVVSYCEALRLECRGSGVQVVTLVPGYVDTPLTRVNSYSMPFLMPASVFADRAFKSIESGCSYRVIPWQMGWVAKLMRVLPNPLFDRLFSGRGRKPRQG